MNKWFPLDLMWLLQGKHVPFNKNTSFYPSLQATCMLSSTAANWGLWTPYMTGILKYFGVGERSIHIQGGPPPVLWSRLGVGQQLPPLNTADCLTVENV